MNSPLDVPGLGDYVDLQEILAHPSVSRIFPTEQSLRWFVRTHREELANSGALISLTNRLKFHPATFERSVVDIGRRELLRRGA